MLILDTDLLTVVQRREGALYDRLDARLEEASVTELIGVTIISFEEQTRGWLAYIAKARSSALQIEAYARLHAAVQRFDQLARARIRIGTMDLKIAAVALANQATLLSSNLSDFQKVPGLRVEDWTRP
jgi:tRNA(fMet)-specific endonuclease VapC